MFNTWKPPSNTAQDLICTKKSKSEKHPVKLRLKLEGNGIKIYTRPDYTPAPLYLDGGITHLFTGEDLRALFDPRNLVFEGYSKAQYERTGRLPEGVYRLGFGVKDYHRDVDIARSFPAVVMMYLSQAPRLMTPRDAQEIDATMTPALRFSWLTPGISNPLADVFYRFRLWELRPADREPQDVIRSTRPLFETEATRDWLLYDATLPALTQGRAYVWQVEAIDREGEVHFKNDLKSAANN